MEPNVSLGRAYGRGSERGKKTSTALLFSCYTPHTAQYTLLVLTNLCTWIPLSESCMICLNVWQATTYPTMFWMQATTKTKDKLVFIHSGLYDPANLKWMKIEKVEGPHCKSQRWEGTGTSISMSDIYQLSHCKRSFSLEQEVRCLLLVWFEP